MSKDFAKVVRTSGGKQVLVYLVNGDNDKHPFAMRCITDFDWCFYEMTLDFPSRENAQAALDKTDVHIADKFYQSGFDLVGDVKA